MARIKKHEPSPNVNPFLSEYKTNAFNAVLQAFDYINRAAKSLEIDSADEDMKTMLKDIDAMNTIAGNIVVVWKEYYGVKWQPKEKT